MQHFSWPNEKKKDVRTLMIVRLIWLHLSLDKGNFSWNKSLYSSGCMETMLQYGRESHGSGTHV